MRIGFNEVRNNKIKSYFLISFFIVLIGVLGAVFGLYMGNLYFGIGLSVFVAIIYSLIGFFLEIR